MDNMVIVGRTLFAFVDYKDPFTPTPVAGEEQPGPVLSILAAKPFDFLLLFFTPHTRTNAEVTCREVRKRFPKCVVMQHELPISDPKDYSSLMGQLAGKVGEIMRMARNTENYICVSSGTAEMRAVWFLLATAGVLPAALLQIGTSAEPLFGAANVKEVRLDRPDWKSLRDHVKPLDYFHPMVPAIESRSAIPEKGLYGKLRALGKQVRSTPGKGGHRSCKPNAETLEPGRLRGTVKWFNNSKGYGYIQRDDYVFVHATDLDDVHVLGGELQITQLDDVLGELQIYIGSAVMRSAAERIATVASTDVPILILGETGTGKELFARLAHRLSERHRKDLVPVNCAAIPKDLMESYLFGHVRGAFTGATSNRIGKFEQAHESTLFLDEIAELTPDAQAKLLRVLQDGNIEPLGTHQPRKFNVRIVSATNRNLQEDMEAGKFREDLYFRLRGVEVSLPPLRERREEIALLAVTLLDRINQKFHRQRRLTKNALAQLAAYYWPGNVRELEAVLRESVLFAKRDELAAEDLKMSADVTGSDCFNSFPEPGDGFDLRAFLAQARAHLIRRALERCGGNQSQAARLLGITRQALNDFLSNPPDKPA